MKASRDQLKALMKELLLEILSEGLPIATTTQPGMVRPPQNRLPIQGMQTEARLANGRRKPQFDPRLDAPVGGRTPTDQLKEAIRREAGGNPVMMDILADTAMTTLPSQLSQGDSMGAGGGLEPPSRNHAPNQTEQFNGDPADVFGSAAEMRADGSSHWADLAFMPAGKKST